MLDTIVAIATPPGCGGIGIVRLSGPNALQIGKDITHHAAAHGVAKFTSFYSPNHTLIDQGISLFFKSPHSFTGEDVVELQAHGSPVVLDQLVACAIHYGARMARPGEFSERAFLNHKIDLTQAEAIADLIAANSEQAARSAVRSLQGAFSEKIHELQQSLTHFRVQIEAMIDFPDEEIDFLKDPKIAAELEKIIDRIVQVKNSVKQGVLLQNGLNIVIAGKPNVGKSSLLNYLSGRDSAIVTNIPGTTRDILRESIQIDGMPLHIIDTAGLRDTDDVVEKEGVRRTEAQLKQADLILWMRDAEDAQYPSVSAGETSTLIPTLFVTNKIDLTHEQPSLITHEHAIEVKISLKKNLGLDLLKTAIKTLAGFQSEERDGFIARRRHVDAIERAYQNALQGHTQLHHHRAGELLAEDLRQAQRALSEITGELSSDDLLGKIFSSFCIGK